MTEFMDVFSSDPMCSDSNVKVVDDVLFEIMCSVIVVRTTPDTNDEGKIGAKTAIDAVDRYQLVETVLDKKTYIKYIKGYMRRIREYLEQNNPERVEAFTTGSMLVVKKILANFNEFQFFMGPSRDTTAGLALVFYKEDGITPFLWLFRDGLKTI